MGGNIVFTDEPRFNVEFSDCRVRVWRRKGERFDQQNIIQGDRYSGGRVLVWAGTWNSKTELVTMQGTLHAARYCD